MKKILILAAISALLLACGSKRNETLKVFNWSSYIDESIIPEFEEWYKAQTGEDIKVIYQTFDLNETALAQIERGHEDYDVVCPSEYIIERMLNNGLLKPLDFSTIPDSINYIKNNRSPYIQQVFHDINPTIDANDYSVAYMWGTTGIIYNTQKVTAEEVSTWDVLRNPKFAGGILIKDAPRDVYGPILIHLRQKELKEGKVTIQDLMHDSSDKAIADVEAFMNEVKKGLLGWETDFGKEQISKGRGVISLNWSGDAIWSIQEAEGVGVSLDYTVPEEGSSLWFDGWVIPKYAENVKAATYFIDFMCRSDIAIRNMEECGYVSANGAYEVLESQIDEQFDPIDLSYFFGEEASSVRVNPILYPDRKVIERCAMLHDWGDDTEKLVAMWSRLKSNNANSMTFVIIALTVLALIVALLRSWYHKRKRHQRRRHS